MVRESAGIDRDRVRLADPSPAHRKERRVFTFLVCGFVLITLLLGVDAWVGYRGANSVRVGVEVLTDNQLVSVPLIDEVQRWQTELNSIQYRLPRANPVERAELKGEMGT